MIAFAAGGMAKVIDPLQRVALPHVVRSLAARDVRAQERSHGTPLEATSGTPAALGRAQALLDAYVHQLFAVGVFHAGPHPGNRFELDDGRLRFHDVGSIGLLDPLARWSLARWSLAGRVAAIAASEADAVLGHRAPRRRANRRSPGVAGSRAPYRAQRFGRAPGQPADGARDLERRRRRGARARPAPAPPVTPKPCPTRGASMNRMSRAVLVAALALPLAACSDRAPAVPPAGGPVQQVGNYTLYFGMLPAAITQGTPHSAGPTDAHGLPRGDFAREHHLLVVVERTRDHVRPADAQVTASVPISGSTVTRTLAPMPINGQMSYGTVFVLPGPDTYVFDTAVRVPGEPAPLHARFAYTQSHTPRP